MSREKAAIFSMKVDVSHIFSAVRAVRGNRALASLYNSSVKLRGGWWLLLLTLGLGLVWLGLASPEGQEPGDRSGASAASLELVELRRQIAALELELGTLATRRRDLSGALEALEIELKLQERRVAEAVAERRLAEQASAELRASMAAIETELATVRAALKRRIFGLYRLGRQGYLRLLLAARPGADTLTALRTVRFLARRDREAVARHEDLRTGLVERQQRLSVREHAAASWADQEHQRASRLAAARREQRVLLAQAERDRLVVAAQAVELAEREQRLGSLFNELAGAGQPPLSGAPIQELMGALEWPASGRVSIGFGPRLDPRYGTAVPHRGIEIELLADTAARAVFPGKVVYAATLDGYGETVVVQHAGRVFSLYAGLDQLETRRGDMVSLGTILGAAKGRLYFEIRVENRPQDPLEWLRSRRE